MPNQPKANEYYPQKAIYGIPISQDELRKIIPSIPKELIERWRRLILPKLDRDWNKNHLMQKMVAGFLLDPLSVQYYLTASCMSALQRLEETTEIFRKRVENENRALNHEELATLGKLTDATKSFVEAAKTVMESCGPRRQTEKAPSAPPKGEPSVEPVAVPEFYRQIEADGDAAKPAESQPTNGV